MGIVSKVINKIKWHREERWKKKLFTSIVYDDWNDKNHYTQEIEYLKKNGDLVVFPYNYRENYRKESDWVSKDERGYFVYTKDSLKPQKLYFCWSPEIAAYKYKNLRIEQDPLSAHRYYTERYYPSEQDILIDIGSAEGKEALVVADICKKLYLFECDPQWLNELKKSFSEYDDKTEIYDCYVGAEDDSQKNIRKLDTIFSDVVGENVFIKMDVEGMEKEVLKGANKLIMNNNVKILLTTYHKQNDAEELSQLLSSWGFEWEFSDNYMLFFYDKNIKPPYFRRGVIRATRKMQ